MVRMKFGHFRNKCSLKKPTPDFNLLLNLLKLLITWKDYYLERLLDYFRKKTIIAIKQANISKSTLIFCRKNKLVSHGLWNDKLF